MRITVRTFQNEQHAEMFIAISQKIMEDTLKDKFKIDFKMIQNKSTKNQVTAIWKYDNEQHLKEVRKYLSKYNSIPNSLSPKEVVFSGDVILESKL
mgnify:FL=1